MIVAVGLVVGTLLTVNKVRSSSSSSSTNNSDQSLEQHAGQSHISHQCIDWRRFPNPSCSQEPYRNNKQQLMISTVLWNRNWSNVKLDRCCEWVRLCVSSKFHKPFHFINLLRVEWWSWWFWVCEDLRSRIMWWRSVSTCSFSFRSIRSSSSEYVSSHSLTRSTLMTSFRHFKSTDSIFSTIVDLRRSSSPFSLVVLVFFLPPMVNKRRKLFILAALLADGYASFSSRGSSLSSCRSIDECFYLNWIRIQLAILWTPNRTEYSSLSMLLLFLPQVIKRVNSLNLSVMISVRKWSALFYFLLWSQTEKKRASSAVIIISNSSLANFDTEKRRTSLFSTVFCVSVTHF